MHKGKICLQGLCAAGLSVVLLSWAASMAQAASSYRAGPQGVEVPAEMHSYDPAVLHITFGSRTEHAEALLPAGEAPESAPEELFDPARLPGGETSGPEDSASPPGPEDAPAAPQQLNVPEPGTFALFGLGLAALLMRFRRTRRRE